MTTLILRPDRRIPARRYVSTISPDGTELPLGYIQATEYGYRTHADGRKRGHDAGQRDSSTRKGGPMSHIVAALYVQRGGCYYDLPDVDPWDSLRDARKYDGPLPVVAHPPCERWGRYWSGGPSAHGRFTLGDDGGCFEAALAAIRRWGGVIEHPEASHAWSAYGLMRPPRDGGWLRAAPGEWTCCVEQGHYGHKARKATWLYVVGHRDPPELQWGPSEASLRRDEGFHSAEERRRAIKTGACQRLSKWARAASPLPFRDLLISIAKDCKGASTCPTSTTTA